MQVLSVLLLIFVISCALAVALTKNLLTACVVFMGQSLAMSIIWMLLASPDLAITEAAVGSGITSLLLFITLKKIHAIDIAEREEAPLVLDAKVADAAEKEEASHGEDQA